MSVTGYPYDGYDGTDESFELLLEASEIDSKGLEPLTHPTIPGGPR